jgi:hypothetical protein
MRYRDIIEGIVGYHGTTRSFKAFRIPTDDFHPSQIGVWFASTPEAAAYIGKTAPSRDKGRPRVITCQIELGNVKAYDTYSDFLADFDNYGGAGDMRTALKSDGYNSIEITNSDTDEAGARTDWAVFDRTQIKMERSAFVGPSETSKSPKSVAGPV